VNTGRAVLQQEERAAVAVGNAALNTGRAVVTQEARAAAWAGQQVQNGARAAGNWVQDRANDAKKWFGGLF
jgi:type II secretory pathway pseudopilin PulG